MSSIRCKGKILDLTTPVVMGIVNVTPDSFYKGSQFEQEDSMLRQVEQMMEEGASIIDIGGQSTRPGSIRLSATEESARVVPFVQKIIDQFPDAILSIDTYHSDVAAAAVDSGVSIVNDVSAGEMDKNMLHVVARLGLPYVAMHMNGNPNNMQDNPQYDDVVKSLITYFRNKMAAIREAGIIDLLIDPGFGFGKTVQHNFELLAQLHQFKELGCPLLVGLSRKSFIQKTIHTDADGALNGTTVLHTLALQGGASILRVHDVKAAVETVKLFQAYKNATP